MLASTISRQTADDRVLQAIDFAYGNLAASTNHKPDRAAFAELARQRGVTHDAFARWAEGKAWAP